MQRIDSLILWSSCTAPIRARFSCYHSTPRSDCRFDSAKNSSRSVWLKLSNIKHKAKICCKRIQRMTRHQKRIDSHLQQRSRRQHELSRKHHLQASILCTKKCHGYVLSSDASSYMTKGKQLKYGRWLTFWSCNYLPLRYYLQPSTAYYIYLGIRQKQSSYFEQWHIIISNSCPCWQLD